MIKAQRVQHECMIYLSTCNISKKAEYECFVENFNQNSVDQILNDLHLCNNSTITKESVNYIASKINDAFQFSAKKVLDTRPPSYNGRNNDGKPWFGYQCKNARRKYHLARRKHNVLKTDASKNDLCIASRFYKKTMNAHINKYRNMQQSKLRKMQKSQPKEYWKYLNSLKSHKKTETPTLSQFHDFFADIYSQEDDSAGDPASHEIEKCIKKLKNSKSPGRDQILNEYLRLTKDQMLHVYLI